MGTAPRKQLASASYKRSRQPKQPKQLKRAYKIPRSLKNAIKKKLVKIVKRRERKVRDEEREKFSVRHKAITDEIREHLRDYNNLWDTGMKTHEQNQELLALIERGHYRVGLEERSRTGGIVVQKAFAREVLSREWHLRDLQNGIRAWLIEQGEDAAEVGETGKGMSWEDAKDAEDENDESNKSNTTEEFDWTSTSTLE